MIDKRLGGWTGSLDRWARREAQRQLLAHPKMHQVRYGMGQRVIRALFSIRTFSGFIGLYFLVNLLFGVLEVFSVHILPEQLPFAGPTEPALAMAVEELMLNISSYLLGAQIGLLGVISLSLTLVTLIAQREGSSTDIQLYYHESLALELVASCVALAVVLCIQFVWPLQMLLHHVGLGAGMQLFKITLFSLHLFWLLVNLCVAAYFIIITFRFVEQASRERFRDRYTAYVVLPRDLRRHLRQQLYAQLGQEGQPLAIPGLVCGVEGEGIAEKITQIHRTSTLVDVHMTGVRWVIRRWLARCAARAGTVGAGVADAQPPCLFISPLMDQPVHGAFAWCHRRGGVPLSGLEKLVLGWSFRFKPLHHQHQAPTPSKILEGLIENAIAQVDGLSPVAFDSAFGEVTRYHQFVLGLSVAEGVDGARFSLAELPGFGWHPPHRPWSSQYRRLFRRGAEVIGEDAHFFNSLAQTPHHLLPRHREASLPAELMRELFHLGPMLTHSLEGWVEHRAAAAGEGAPGANQALHLSGLDAAIHQEVVSGLVQAWELPLHDAPSLYGWRNAAGQGTGPFWKVLCESFPFLWLHVAETAHSLLCTVRKGDATGARLFSAALMRWADTALHKSGGDLHRRHISSQPLQALVEQAWPVSGDHGRAKPADLFVQIIRETHEDVLFLVLLLLLVEQAKNPEQILYGETARTLLLSRQADVWLAAAARNHIAIVQPVQSSYGRELERLRQSLKNMLAHASTQHPQAHQGHELDADELADAEVALLLASEMPEKYILPELPSFSDGSRFLTKLAPLSPRIGESFRFLFPENNEKARAARLKQVLEGG